MNKIIIFLCSAVILLGVYGMIGTGTRVDEIKKLAPEKMKERGWKILRYEGYQWGSFSQHGGKCWYHVCNIDNPNIQYRVQVSIWNGELQYYYGQPEVLDRVQIDY